MYKNIKKNLDLIFSLLLLLLISPALLIIAILVRINLGSPILFKQHRPGLNERIFIIYKFRTMTNATDQNGKPLPDKDRATKFGLFLRKKSLDELPELFNIFKGDMSFIGPRPLVVEYLPLYSEKERARHSIRPGITGLAQVNGRNHLGWDERFALDCEYVNKVSLMLDLKILFKTIPVVLKKEGFAEDETTIRKDLDEERKVK